MAGLVRTHDLTDASQHGWAVDYLIQREDGAGLHVEVRCWDRAREAADNASNEAAERANSPASRGAVMISIWFDPADDGRLRERVSYERSGQ